MCSGLTYSFSCTRKQRPANEHMEREVGLHRVELAGREKALAQRRHAEIDEGVVQAVAAQPAVADANGRIHGLSG